MMQYFPWLIDSDLWVEVLPFFDDRYLENLYAGNSTFKSVIGAFAGRLQALGGKIGGDLIWVEKEVLPWVPWAIEHALLPGGVPIVSDYDDAVFHRYDQHRFGLVRTTLGQKIDRVMAASQLVFAGNAYLAERADRAGARRVEIVPTVVDTKIYSTVRNDQPGDTPCVGWIGTPETWDSLASPVVETITPVLEDKGAVLRAVGADLQSRREANLEIVPWSEAKEVEDIQSMDIGLMPLPDTPWSRGKCGYKLIQYMACGLPVVASPVGVNRDIVEHGVNGFLASNDVEWRDAIATLLGDAELRRRMGEVGRRKIEAQYSLDVWGPRVAGMLTEVAGEKS